MIDKHCLILNKQMTSTGSGHVICPFDLGVTFQADCSIVGGTFADALDRKLGLRSEQRIALIGATPEVLHYFSEQFPDLEFVTSLRGGFDVVIYFVTRKSELTRRVATLTRAIRSKGALWIAWPKKTSGIVTDLTFDVVQDAGLSQTLVDTKICSISECWSGLRFAHRVSQQVPVSVSV